MTVGELIEALQSYDPYDDVVLYDYERYEYTQINEMYPRIGKVVLSN